MDNWETHYRKLERMYLAAPCNAHYRPQLTIGQGRAELVIPVRREPYHAAGAVHGAAYFKAIDDAAFFTVNSLVTDVFVLTTNLNCRLIRPITEGEIRAVGEVVSETRTIFVAETVLTGAEGRQIGRGSGSFVRSRMALNEELGYRWCSPAAFGQGLLTPPAGQC